MSKVVDVSKWPWTWPFKVNDIPDWTKDLRDEFYTKNNQFRGITFDSTKKKKVSFSNMAGGGHIGLGYCGARGGVADKHLGDLLCLGTR